MDSAAGERLMPAARAALSAFAIEPVDLELVWVSENVTFRVTDARDGGVYALRLHRPGYHDLAALNSERLWTRALAEAGVNVPVGVAARDGNHYVPVAAPDDGQLHYAGVTRWAEGEVMADALDRDGPGQAPALFRRLGATVAALHNQAAGWTPPPGFVRHALDAEGLMGEVPFWGRFWESAALSPGERALLATTRTDIAAALDRLGRDSAIFSLIHADLHPNNALLSGGRLTVIDFDDAAFGWHAYDIAVALFNTHAAPYTSQLNY